MRRVSVSAFVLVLSTAFAAVSAVAQSAVSSPEQAPPPGTTVLTTGTQLVQVDVVVTDASGKAVHDLKATDFVIDEDKKPQTVKNFEETIAIDSAHSQQMPKVNLTPGTFTDYSPVPDKAPLTVILLDRLNTPFTDQLYVKEQLRRFLASSLPPSRTAIFGLTSRLVMLQGFTSDPAILRAAVENKGMQASVLLSSAGETSMAEAAADSGAPASTIADLQQFEAESASFQTQLRIRYTLTAFDQLASYLASYPGRKNVIWFSGSFPLNINFDPNIQYGFNVEANFSDQFRKTVNLLALARAAVYPVEAGGLKTDPSMEPAAQGPSSLAAQINAMKSFQNAQNNLHNTMSQLASNTGGQAFYNNNDLVGAINESLAHGSDYYTLAYSPSNHDTRDGFRSIRLRLVGPPASRGLKIAYRRGYYTLGAKANAALANRNSAAGTVDPGVLAALQHGAPAPSEILFKVRVLPAAPAESTESHRPLIEGKLYTVDFTALTGKIDLVTQPDGHHRGAVEFAAYVFDGDGKLLNSQVKVTRIDTPPDGLPSFRRGGIACSAKISAPPKAHSIRLAVHDLSSGRLGVVEVPLASVRNLPPAQ